MTIRNFTSPEGHFLGTKLAAWCDDAEPRARLKVPELPTRCGSCAFRQGPHLANGSPATQMDALKCVIEGETFGCHDVHREGSACAGWMMMVLGNEDAGPGKAPWDFIGGADADNTVAQVCKESLLTGPQAEAAGRERLPLPPL